MINTEQVPSPRSVHSSREDRESVCKLISHRKSHKTSKVIYRVGKWLSVGGIHVVLFYIGTLVSESL